MKRLSAFCLLLVFSTASGSAAVIIPNDLADASKFLQVAAARCDITTDVPYIVRSRQRDALRYDHYFDAVPGREVAVAKTDYNEFRVALNVDADWQLTRYSTDDGSSIVLSHVTAPLVSQLAYYHLKAPVFRPETQHDIRLGDSVARVFALFGHGLPVRDACGRTHYVFGWRTEPGARSTIDYEIRAGRIESITYTSGCCGIMRWASPG